MASATPRRFPLLIRRGRALSGPGSGVSECSGPTATTGHEGVGVAAVAGRRPYADCPHPLRPLADGRDSLPAARHPARGGGADRRLHGSCAAAAGHRTQWDTWPNPPRDPRYGWLGARAPARGVGRQRWKRHGDDRVKPGEKPSTGKSRCTCWNPHRHTVQAVRRSRVETLSSHLSRRRSSSRRDVPAHTLSRPRVCTGRGSSR